MHRRATRVRLARRGSQQHVGLENPSFQTSQRPPMTEDVLDYCVGGDPMAYTAEMLAALSDIDLDAVVEALVMDREPEPRLLPRLRRRAVRRYAQIVGNGAEQLAYSSSLFGMGRVMESMLDKGYTVAVAPGGVVWVAGNGKELKYVGGIAMPRAVAIAAVLAVQGE
jgi:hypothetical protein